MEPMKDTKTKTLHSELQTTNDPEGDEIHERNKNDPENNEISEQFDSKNPIGPQGDEISEQSTTPSPLKTVPEP